MIMKYQCSKEVPMKTNFLRMRQCTRKGTIEIDGKWYCWQHNLNRKVIKKDNSAKNRILYCQASSFLTKLMGKNNVTWIYPNVGERKMIITDFTYFYPEAPMLIHKDQPLFNEVSNNPNWIAEYKYNGCRLELHNFTNGNFEFWDRHHKKLSYNPNQEVSDALKQLPLQGYNLFDGELRNNKVVGVRQKIILYDVFIWNGELLINKSFEYRRQILESILKVENEPLGITKQFPNNFDKVYDDAIKNEEIEGLVMKNKLGILNINRTSSKDSTWMLKVRKVTGRHKF